VRDRFPPSVLIRKLRVALDRADAPGRGAHLLVAVSGGPDSTALLAGLVLVAAERGMRLTAAHARHGLRGVESEADAARVRALAGGLAVPLVERDAPVRPGAGLEARARRSRYRALAAVARDVGATWIVTGHTRDDQVETVLLRLARGAGRRGLGGIRPVRGRLFRPLLDATRADVRRFLAERGVDFAVDRTNADLGPARNRMRRLVVPLLEAEFNPQLGASVAGLAERLRDEDDFLDAEAQTRAAALVAGGALRVAVAAEPRALARRMIRDWLARGARRAPGALHVERVLALARGSARGAVAVPGPARVRREGDVLVRRAGRAATPQHFTVPIAPGGTVEHPAGAWRLVLSAPRPRRSGEDRPPDADHALFDADRLDAALVVRSPETGDRIRLLAGGTRKLQDVLVDAKVPREARSETPVLVAGGDILWVAGLARGRGAALGPATARIVEGVVVRRAKDA